MKKTYIYSVNGNEFRDNTAFGTAWKDAVKVAKASHSKIMREVVSDDSVRIEFFANGGAFLNVKFYDEKKVKIF